MKNLKKENLKFSESQLLSIKDRIKHWNTKDKIIPTAKRILGEVTINIINEKTQ